MLKFLFSVTSLKEKFIFIGLCLYAVISGALDLISMGIGLALLTGQSQFPDALKPFLAETNLTLLFGLFFGVSSLIRAGSTFFNAKFTYSLSGRVTKRALSEMPLHYSACLNSTNNNTTTYTDLFLVKFPMLSKGIIFPFMQLITALIMILVYLLVILVAADTLTLYIIVSVVILYLLFHFLTKTLSNDISESLAVKQREFADDIMAINSGIREFIFCNVAKSRFKETLNLGFRLRMIERNQSLIIQLPKFFIEGSIVCILFVALSYLERDQAIEVAIGAGLLSQKFMPLAQQVQRSITNLQTNNHGVSVIYRYFTDLDSTPDNKTRVIHNFDGLLKTLKSVSPGDWVQIDGPSGRGKTYILDVISGIRMYPGEGNLYHKQLGASTLYYLSQDTLILRGSLEQCTGFIPSCHTHHLKKLGLQRFQNISDIDINNTSGGERQRLALLRMLIQRPDVILMDEATNALDANIEEIVCKHIKTSLPDSRVIFISHNKELRKHADFRWEI
ncbi:ATP-binding cassette domain-containing protein [Octadecabacter sp.]|nr:ATP-binding cassette domain-containing protein [Octadecabacter sp.]